MRQARIIESNPDMLWPTAIASDQSMDCRYSRIVSSPKST